MTGDPRAERAERVLAAGGVAGATVRAAGPDGEIALLALPDEEWPALFAPERRALLDEVKAAGFRYVALDLDATPPAP